MLQLTLYYGAEEELEQSIQDTLKQLKDENLID